MLRRLLSPFCSDACEIKRGELTASDLYRLGLTGGEDSSRLRDLVAEKLELPSGMGAKAFLAAVNIITDKTEFEKIAESIS